MKVKLVAVTHPHINEANNTIHTAEDFIVYTARVSNPSNQMNTGTAPKLIAYLIKNKHWSPFEMADMTVEIVTSRAIAQQILRHRSFSFQEFSQRYATATEFELIELRKQADKNRQSSSEVIDPNLAVRINPGDPVRSYLTPAVQLVNTHIKASEEIYKGLIEAGVAKESARFILPLSTQTKLYMKGSIRSWIHYLEIRCDEHTQKEHRDIAVAIRQIFAEAFPNIYQALVEAEEARLYSTEADKDWKSEVERLKKDLYEEREKSAKLEIEAKHWCKEAYGIEKELRVKLHEEQLKHAAVMEKIGHRTYRHQDERKNAEELQDEVKKLKEYYDKVEHSLRVEIKQHIEARMLADQQVSTLTTGLDGLQARADKQEKLLANYEQQVRALNSKIDVGQAQLDSRNEVIESQRIFIGHLQDQVKSLSRISKPATKPVSVKKKIKPSTDKSRLPVKK